MKTKIACDGRQLEWEPNIQKEIDPDTEEPFEWDKAEPGTHAPRVYPPGLDEMDTISHIMHVGRICVWCKEYIPSMAEMAIDTVLSPSKMWRFLKKKMGRP